MSNFSKHLLAVLFSNYILNKIMLGHTYNHAKPLYSLLQNVLKLNLPCNMCRFYTD